jgi:hypothetical protein
MPSDRIHGRTCGYKGSLLEIQEEEWWGPGGSWKPRDHISILQMLLKPMIAYGKGKTRRFPPQN